MDRELLADFGIVAFIWNCQFQIRDRSQFRCCWLLLLELNFRNLVFCRTLILQNNLRFHQVEGLHDKYKVNSGCSFASAKPQAYNRQHWSKSQTSWNVDGRRGYARKFVPEIKREFRVVRDNRTSQNVVADIKESFQKSHKDNHQGSSIGKEQSSNGRVVDRCHTTTKSSNGHDLCQKLNGRSDSGSGLNKNEKSSERDIKQSTKEKMVTEFGTSTKSSKEVKNNTQTHTSNSVIGVYSSSLDPVHVPSSRPAGTVGIIRRKVGVVGTKHHVIDVSNSFATSLSEQDASSSVSKATVSNMTIGESIVTNHQLAKHHQEVTGQQKGINTNMEWKPKSSRKPSADDCANVTNPAQPTGSSKKLSEVNLSNNKHVIIPEHLKVTKSEQANLIFGSFGVSGSDALTSKDSPSNDPSASKSSSEFVAVKDSDNDQPIRVSQIDDPTYATLKSQLSVQIDDDYTLSTRDIESYPDAELNQRHIPSYTSFEPQGQNHSSFSEFPAYEPQMTIRMPFTKMTMQDNVQLQGSRLGQEITSSHVTNNNSASIASLMEQQQQQQQQQPIQQLSPNYANLVPNRQIYPQMYFPQMLMPNYSNISVQNNHPSNRSNYLMMPGGIPQLATESMKYKPSVQSLPPTAGYGSHSNLGLYAFGNTAGMIDAYGTNYNKDNNLYVPNTQGQSENGTWIQNPREMSTFRPTPCYNMAGQQSPGLQTFMPANLGLNQPAAYPISQLQYTSFYPPPPHQPGSVMGSGNPSLNSTFGMIPASPTQMAPPYQRHHQLGGHLGWTNANF